MKFLKRLPFIRVENTIINLDNLSTVWLEESLPGDFELGYAVLGGEGNYTIKFKTKKAAVAALDEIMVAINVPVIDEDEDEGEESS
jgi:hypothetical protein